MPEDVDEEFQAEQLLIDCNVVVGAARHETARPARKMWFVFLSFLILAMGTCEEGISTSAV